MRNLKKKKFVLEVLESHQEIKWWKKNVYNWLTILQKKKDAGPSSRKCQTRDFEWKIRRLRTK